MNLPNKLTFFRVLLIPVFIVFFFLKIPGNYLYACGIFIVASITDVLDGAIARKHNLVTTMGKLLDPIADKLLVGSAIILLCTQGMIDPVLAIVLIGREFVISGFRVVAAAEGLILAADVLGKMKTVIQSVAIGFILFSMNGVDNGCISVEFIAAIVGQVLIWLSGALSIISCANYIIKNRSVLKDINK